jgi:hypothetical protein
MGELCVFLEVQSKQKIKRLYGHCVIPSCSRSVVNEGPVQSLQLYQPTYLGESEQLMS